MYSGNITQNQAKKAAEGSSREHTGDASEQGHPKFSTGGIDERSNNYFEGADRHGAGKKSGS
jgi:hypothetical protein